MERFVCDDASLIEVIFFYSLWQKGRPPVRVDIAGCTTKYKQFVEALHDGSRYGVWTRECEWKARVFINHSKHVCILR